MPIPFPKSVVETPMCSNCGEGRLIVDCSGDGMLCPECDTEFYRVGNLAYRADEMQSAEQSQRHNVVGSLRSMAELFPDDNIVVLGDDLMTQLDAERNEGRRLGFNKAFYSGFVLGVGLVTVIGGLYLQQLMREMRGL